MLPIKNGDENYWLNQGITQAWGNPAMGYPGGRHNGTDFGTMTGTGIVAAWGGQVVKADYDSGYGRHVRILHPSGEMSIYGHLKSLAVAAGQEVAEGDYLGESGGGLEDDQRGMSTGPHLHFEVRSNPYDGKTNIDPLAWLGRIHAAAEPLPALHDRVIVTNKALPWVRIREQPGLDHKEIGKLCPGEIMTIAPGVNPAMIGGLEWWPSIYWICRGPKDAPWLEQI